MSTAVERVRKAYVEERLTIAAVAKRLHMDWYTVKQLMEIGHIEHRTRADQMSIAQVRNFPIETNCPRCGILFKYGGGKRGNVCLWCEYELAKWPGREEPRAWVCPEWRLREVAE